MYNLQVFKNEEFGELRTQLINNEPWFILNDICQPLELTNPRMLLERLNKDDVKQIYITDNLGRNQLTNAVNESGLYDVVLRSDKPKAKDFRRWVTKDILPSIRKHGAYMTPETIERSLSNPDFIIQIATELKKHREQLKKEQEQRKLLEDKIESDKHRVIFADSVAASVTTILIRELAKLISQNGFRIGGNRLFEWMRNNGYLVKNKGTDYNMPTQRAIDLELFEVKETAITHSNGKITVSKTPKVTGKGQIYFIDKIISNKLVDERQTSRRNAKSILNGIAQN